MKNAELQNLNIRIKSLAIFRTLLDDEVIKAFCSYLDAIYGESTQNAVSAYSELVSRLYESGADSLGEYIEDIVNNNENVYVKTVGQKKALSEHITAALKNELEILGELANISPEKLTAALEWQGFLPAFETGGKNIAESFMHRAANIGKYGYGIFAKNTMFVVDSKNKIVPVKSPDTISFDDMVDYESERNAVLENTKALLDGKPAANILLTGAAGTGKSSTVKAVVNKLCHEGLRIVEVRKDQLTQIPKLLDELSQNPLRFILFIDDISFKNNDDNFNSLKAILEGSVSAKSNNVAVYATSNRTHIVSERFSDRDGDEIHRTDTVWELISLSERFGLHIPFRKPNKEVFLNIVHSLASEAGIEIGQEKLDLLAERFALERAGRTPRIARQFVDGLISGTVSY